MNVSASPRRFGMEDLKEGDTFVDTEGEPRRIVEITDDGKIKTADGTEREYTNEIEARGPLNSDKAQLARGGKLIGEFPPEVKLMTPPGDELKQQEVRGFDPEVFPKFGSDEALPEGEKGILFFDAKGNPAVMARLDGDLLVDVETAKGMKRQ